MNPGAGAHRQSVKEPLLDDLAVLDRVEADLVHLSALARRFGCHVDLEAQDKVIAVHIGPFGLEAVDVMVGKPPVALAMHGSAAVHLTRRALHCLTAYNVLRPEALRFLEFACLQDSSELLCDIGGAHDGLLRSGMRR